MRPTRSNTAVSEESGRTLISSEDSSSPVSVATSSGRDIHRAARPAWSARAWSAKIVWRFQGGLLGSAVMATLGLSALIGVTGCEDEAIGRACDVLADDTPDNVAVFNDDAPECPSHLCIKPARSPSSGTLTNTQAFCTAECKSDGDCSDHQKRDVGDESGLDLRCAGGFRCAIPFEIGPQACKRLCVCEDFLPAGDDELPIPLSCQ